MKKRNTTESAVSFIERTGGAQGAMFTPVEQFAAVVHQGYPAFAGDYVLECALEVINGKRDSFAPSYGTDVFFIKRIDVDTVIATTKLKSEKELRKYQLVV